MDHNQQNKIAVINDFSSFGRCSIAVALPIISAMKIQCCPLPTALFSNHTGFDSFFRTDCTDFMPRYAEEWEKLGLQFQGIATGYLGSVHQIDLVEDFLRRFDRPETIVLVDPVMGDYGALYPTYTQELAENVGRLLRYADILTPNLTEASILTGVEYRPDPSEGELLEMCQALSERGPQKVVISGLDYGDTLGNFIFEVGKPHQLLKVPKVGVCRSGTGDVFASILIADAVNGSAFPASVKKAADFISHALERTTEMGIPRTDGICFEEILGELIPD
jgi:pyridoxine kinase